MEGGKHRGEPGTLQLQPLALHWRRHPLNEVIYAKKLAHFKDNEKPEVVLLIADEPTRL